MTYRKKERNINLNTLAITAVVILIFIGFIFLASAVSSNKPKYHTEPEISLAPAHTFVAKTGPNHGDGYIQNLKMTFIQIWNIGNNDLAGKNTGTPVYIIPKIPCQILGYSVQNLGGGNDIVIQPSVIHDITKKIDGKKTVHITNSYLSIQIPEKNIPAGKGGFKVAIIHSSPVKNDFYATGGIKNLQTFTSYSGKENEKLLKINSYILFVPTMVLFVLSIISLAFFSAGKKTPQIGKFILNSKKNRKTGLIICSLLVVYSVAIFLMLFYHITFMPGWI